MKVKLKTSAPEFDMQNLRCTGHRQSQPPISLACTLSIVRAFEPQHAPCQLKLRDRNTPTSLRRTDGEMNMFGPNHWTVSCAMQWSV
eukprot:s3144_g10.t1